jgi:hypothetical protein
MSDLLQILQRTGVKATATFSVDGVATDSGTQVKVDVVKPDGTLLVTQANATDEAGAGVYGYQLDPQADPTRLRLEWSGTIGGVAMTIPTWVEVLGGHLFGIGELRAFKVNGEQPFAATASPLFTDDQLSDTRAAVLDEFTTILGFSPVPRHYREVLDGDGTGTLLLAELHAHRLLSVAVGGVAQSAGGYTLKRSGVLHASSNYAASGAFAAGVGNVAVEYVAGWQRVEGIGRHVAMTMAAAELLPDGLSNAVSVTTPDGISYSYEPSEVGRGGYQRWTGIRKLDRWLNLHSQSGIAVA